MSALGNIFSIYEAIPNYVDLGLPLLSYLSFKLRYLINESTYIWIADVIIELVQAFQKII